MTDSTVEHILETRDLHAGYDGAADVLRGLTMSTPAGRFACILGPNGSGKTTLLKTLLGQVPIRSGCILLDDRPIGSYRPDVLARMMSYVPQVPESAFSFTVQDLILMGRFAHAGVLGLAGAQDLTVARLAMEMTGTTAFAGRTLDELSGGEAQCVMIARALAQQPSIMLLDEPTSHLDIRNQLHIYRMMQRLAHEWHMAVVCVSHDINLASRFADELVLVRDGQVHAHGRPVNVLDADILEAVYAVHITLVNQPDSDVPLVVAR